jgi:hypothetical protein
MLVPRRSEVHLHDVVELLEDTRATHFDTGRPLLLQRDQLGTAVMTYDGAVFEVEFAGRERRARWGAERTASSGAAHRVGEHGRIRSATLDEQDPP